MEEWKDIEGYEGKYKISTLGRVISYQRKEVGEYFLKHQLTKLGYPEVVLCRNQKLKHRKIHQLIAQAFIPNPENKPSINHIDGDKLNFSIENLEWCTAKENCIHAYRSGLIKRSFESYNFRRKKVIDTDTGDIFHSVRYLCERHGLNENTMRGRLNGNLKNNTQFKFL